MSQQYQKQKEKWIKQGYDKSTKYWLKKLESLRDAYDILIEENNRLRTKLEEKEDENN
jgi:hypothetical protein